MNPTFSLKIRNSLLKSLLAGIAILTAAAAQTQATVIVGNSTPSAGSDGIGHFGSSTNQAAAAGFTMPGQDYTLTDVLLRLNSYDGPSEAVVGIYLDNAGLPGSLFATLTDPASVSLLPTDYTFLPSGTVTLAANTKYWLVVSADPGSETAVFAWNRAFVSPTGVATFNAYDSSQNGGVTWNSPFVAEGFNLRFTINGEPVVASVPDTGEARRCCWE
jgi:hypothetical protein